MKGSLRAALANPPASAKPMTRWWWFGGAVTPEEITRELTFMKEAGLRGAEIQPVYPLAVDDPAGGIRNLRYVTDEWVAVLRHAVREARRLSLQLDFTLGSGWPYGGPFVPAALSARRLRVLSQDVAGPRDVAWDVTPQLTGDDRVVAAVLAPWAPTRASTSPVRASCGTSRSPKWPRASGGARSSGPPSTRGPAG